jgi:hypothetical protein
LADERLAVYDATFQEYLDYYRKRGNVHERTAINSAVIDSSLGRAVVAVSNEAVARQGTPVNKGKGTGKVRSARSVNAEAERREHGQKVLESYIHDNSPPTRRSVETTPKVDGENAINPRQIDTTHQRELALKSFLGS